MRKKNEDIHISKEALNHLILQQPQSAGTITIPVNRKERFGGVHGLIERRSQSQPQVHTDSPGHN